MKPILNETLATLAELQTLAQKMTGYLRPGTLLFFDGPLGAGKTAFISALCAASGIHGVSSPTYALHQAYQAAGLVIDHLDLYRLETEDQLESAGIWDLFSQKNSVVMVEWAERVPAHLWPLDWQKIFIKISYDLVLNQRHIFIYLDED